MWFIKDVCEISSVLKVIYFIEKILNVLLFIIPICLILMISVDLLKNVIAQDTEQMKKNFNLAIKRIIMTVFLFLVPNIVYFVVSLLGDLGVPYTNCLLNANLDKISELETQEQLVEEQNEEDGTSTQSTTDSSGIVADSKITDVTLSISSKKFTLMDEASKKLTVTVSPSNAIQEVTWTSSNSKVATVNSSGVVTAKSVGTATITATSKANANVSIKCKVTVRKIKVLFVGNSKTNWPKSIGSTIPKRFASISESGGYDVSWTFSSRGGKTLQQIYDISSLRKKMEKSFDYVVLQEASAAYSSTDITEYYNGVSSISKLVKEKNSNIQIYIRKLWVYQNSSNSSIKRAYANTDKVINKLKKNYNYDALSIHDGEAFYYVLDQYPNISIIGSDKLHQTATGAYLSALCIYSTLFQQDPTLIEYRPDISKSTDKILKKVAKTYCMDSN